MGAVDLIFPSDSVIVVAGVPGAGKTTLLRRSVDRAAARVVDTDDRARRGPLLYPGHYARIALAIAGRKPVVIHSRGTLPATRRMIALLAAAARPSGLSGAAPRRPRERRGRPAPPRPDRHPGGDGPAGRALARAARRGWAEGRGLGVGRDPRPRRAPRRSTRCASSPRARGASDGVDAERLAHPAGDLGLLANVFASTKTCRSQPSISSSPSRRISSSSVALVVPSLAIRAWMAITSSKRAGERKRTLASPTTTSRPRSTIDSQLPIALARHSSVTVWSK